MEIISEQQCIGSVLFVKDDKGWSGDFYLRLTHQLKSGKFSEPSWYFGGETGWEEATEEQIEELAIAYKEFK